MKKTALLLILVLALSGCMNKVNIDDLISAYELPKYTNSLDIEISDSEDSETSTDNPSSANTGEVITID